jgi:tetratricopeptide (TPR) repeat protein
MSAASIADSTGGFMRASIAVCVILVAGTIAAATPTLDEAKALFEDRRIPQARPAFETLARTGPFRAEATFYLGRIADLEEDHEKAGTYFEAAVALDPKNPRYHFWVGKTYGEVAHTINVLRAAAMAKKVQRAFETAVALDPKYVEARIGLMDFYSVVPYFMGGSEEKAQAQLAAIEAVDPPYAHLARARMHRRADRNELIKKEYEAAVKRFPKDPRPHIWLSSYLTSKATMDAAVREAFEAVRVAPSYMPGWYHVGRVAVASGKNLAEGEAALKKYLTYVPGDDEPTITMARYQLGLLYETMGKKELARAELQEVARRAPKWHGVRSALKRVGG